MSDLQSELRRLQEAIQNVSIVGGSGHRSAFEINTIEMHEEDWEEVKTLAENLLPRILTALAAPAVKPFEWFVCGKSWYAITPFGNYNIDREGSRFKWHVCFDEMHDEHEGEAPTLEAAQSAAWQHWSERIGGALKGIE